MGDKAGRSGIRDIADALQISIGTVDRALHGRAGVSEGTKARVLQLAKQLGYEPNVAAQALKLNRRIAIGVVLPERISHFFDPLRAGIRAAAAAAAGVQVRVDFHEYPRMGVGDLETFEAAVQGRPDGLIFLPGDARRYAAPIRRAAASGTALMCVGSDAPDTERIGSVAAHAYVSGSIAAELLSYKLPHQADVAIFTGELQTLDHADKLQGFAITLRLQSRNLRLLPALESHDDPEEAYKQAVLIMSRSDRPKGLYLSTANSLPVLQALEELNLLGTTHVITTDVFAELIPFIETGKVLATLNQRPYTQGKVAFETLFAYLVTKRKPQPAVRLAPHVVLRSNLSLFANRMSAANDDVDAELQPL